MNPLFKNITKYNKNNYDQFLDFHSQKFSLSYNLYTLIMSVLLIVCIIFNILDKSLLFVLMFFCALILFLLYRLYFPYKKLQKTEQQYKNNELVCTYKFYKWYFTLNDKTFYYFKLYKVFETNDYFYLYINDENAALVNKKGFKFGKTEDFTNFIKKKCLFKYSKQA